MHGRHFPFILLMLSGAASNVVAQPPIPRPVQTFPVKVFNPAVSQVQNIAGQGFRQSPIQQPVPISHPDQIESQLKSLSEQFAATGLIEEARATAAIAARIREAHFNRLLQAHQTQPEEPTQRQIVLRVQMAEFQVTPTSLQLLGELIGNPRLAENPNSIRNLSAVFDQVQINECLAKIEREGFLQTSCRSQATILDGRTTQLKFAPEAKNSEPRSDAATEPSNEALGDKLQFIGTTLKATAVIRQNNVIALSLIAQNTTSSPDQGTTSTQINSEIEVLDGQTLVLAGLASAGTLTEVTRIPVLGDIPLMGRLFSTRKTSAIRTERILVITPEIQAAQAVPSNAVQPAAHVRPSR